jgi:multidrug resistance efflux pump
MTKKATEAAAATIEETPPAPTHAPAPEAKYWRPPARKLSVTIAIIVLAIIAMLAILDAWGLPPFRSSIERTENAFIRGRVAVISPQVSGYVVKVAVRDFAEVRAGQLLARIDDRIYRARVAQARANLATQLAALANSRQARASRTASVEGQGAALANARAQQQRARADLVRIDDLTRRGWVSVRDHEQAIAALAQAEAGVRQALASGEIARQDVRTVDVGRGGLEAQVEVAKAQLRLAEIDLGNVEIRAPESGQLGEVGVRLGQYVTNGTQLVSLVPHDRWVIANFKEAQTGHMLPGQPAFVTVDALGGMRLDGKVERLSPAAGSEFAVLKADNATGNFVKIPQRIGVRIVLRRGQSTTHLSPGMSVEAAVDTRPR